jgi:hypothetical protein
VLISKNINDGLRNTKAYCVLKYPPIRNRGNVHAISTPSKERGRESRRFVHRVTLNIFKNILLDPARVVKPLH